ncbi:hypothetical protein KRR40_40255 [Niabella defluvii]|nr:hypothetical protein KRR40_40255 [Niabella sp. I65]
MIKLFPYHSMDAFPIAAIVMPTVAPARAGTDGEAFPAYRRRPRLRPG